jgi:hypothetical protein
MLTEILWQSANARVPCRLLLRKKSVEFCCMSHETVVWVKGLILSGL